MSEAVRSTNSDVARVSTFLQRYMLDYSVECMTADECADLLSRYGILAETPPKRGFNFREMLRLGRDGKLDRVKGAWQKRPHTRWYIYRV